MSWGTRPKEQHDTESHLVLEAREQQKEAAIERGARAGYCSGSFKAQRNGAFVWWDPPRATAGISCEGGVTAFLRAGITLLKLDSFQDLLEENAYRLTDHRRMFDIVPFILKCEEEQIQEEIAGKHLSVIFDSGALCWWRMEAGAAIAMHANADEVNDWWGGGKRAH